MVKRLDRSGVTYVVRELPDGTIDRVQLEPSVAEYVAQSAKRSGLYKNVRIVKEKD